MTTREDEDQAVVVLWHRVLAWVALGAAFTLLLLGLDADTVDGRHVLALVLAGTGLALLLAPRGGGQP